jgi:hypothetical protein
MKPFSTNMSTQKINIFTDTCKGWELGRTNTIVLYSSKYGNCPALDETKDPSCSLCIISGQTGT